MIIIAYDGEIQMLLGRKARLQGSDFISGPCVNESCATSAVLSD